MPGRSSRSRSQQPVPAVDPLEAAQPAFDEFRTRLGYALRAAHIAAFQHFSRTVTKGEISPLQFSILLVIERRPGVNPAEISKASGVKRANIAVLVRELVGMGLVARLPDTADRRYHKLALTPLGRRKLASWMKDAERHEARLTELIGARREEFLRLLLKIADALGETDAA